MISFEETRQIAIDRVGPTWEPGDCGEYTVAPYGYEDATAWLLVDGGRRLVIDGDFDCEPVGRGCTFVDKRTGEVFFLTYLEDQDGFDAMTRVGQHPPDPYDYDG